MQSLITNMKKLPIDIIREYIVPYTYKKQSSDLCEDIRSYIECRNYILNMYITRYRFLGDNNTDWIEWLDNDIQRFMNEDITQIHGFTLKFIQRYKRLYMLANKQDVDIITTIWYRFDKRKCLNFVLSNLGILTPNEREDLIVFLYLLQQEMAEEIEE